VRNYRPIRDEQLRLIARSVSWPDDSIARRCCSWKKGKYHAMRGQPALDFCATSEQLHAIRVSIVWMKIPCILTFVDLHGILTLRKATWNGRTFLFGHRPQRPIKQLSSVTIVSKVTEEVRVRMSL